MLPKENRLKKETDFDKVHRKGLFFPGKHLVIKTLSNSLENSRLGIVISKKISKKATDRNKIKRQIREILRLALKEDRIKPGFDVIIIVKASIISENYDSIEKNMVDIFFRANLINKM